MRTDRYTFYASEQKNGIKSILRKVYLKMELMRGGVRLKAYKPKICSTDQLKYNVSLCAIFKDEANYLKEWIEFHKIVGVEHFYLYNNFSSDNYKDVLEKYINEGTVELIDFPVPQGQMKAYEDCVRRDDRRSKWLGFIDLDEFVVPVDNDTIYDFLKQFDKTNPVVLINWRMFGASGKINRNIKGLVTEDFTVCWDKWYDMGKVFFNTSYDFCPNYKYNTTFHHYMWAACKGKMLPPINAQKRIVIRIDCNYVNSEHLPIQINHYFTKSFEEYAMKKKKGDVFWEKSPYTDQYFFNHDKLATSADYKIFKYLVRLKNNMKEV